jgi:hypothetical protein
MTTFITEGGFIGNIVNGLTGISGSLFLSLMMILLILIVIALALNIPAPIIAIIYLPLMITATAFIGDFLAMLGCSLIMLGFVIADVLFPR